MVLLLMRHRWWTGTRRVQRGGHPSPRPRSLRTTLTVAAAALQLSAVRLRTRSRGWGRQRWAVAALDDGFICSLIFIQTDSLLSHKSYYITSMTTPIYICRRRCSPIFSLIPPLPPCQLPSSRCLHRRRPAPPAPSLRIRRREGVGGGAQGRRHRPRRDRQW